MAEGEGPHRTSAGVNAAWLYKLKPKAPFHFGERGVGVEITEEVFHSDSLFSALCCILRDGEGEEALKKLLDTFSSSPPFLVSSAFPYAGKVLFFPKPMLRPRIPREKARDYKKIRFVSQRILEALLRQEEVGGQLERDNIFHSGTLWVTAQERALLPKAEGEATFWRIQTAPRVTVDRLSSASEVYHAGRVVFGERCGLFFLLRAQEEHRARVERLLGWLGDAGLGGERTSGHGQFAVEGPENLELAGPQEANTSITLSLYHPTWSDLKGGILDEPAAYGLVMRRGWIYSPERGGQRRKGVRMLAEGSVLRGSPVEDSTWREATTYGDLVDVTPEIEADKDKHKVYRYGFAFPVPAYIREAQDG